MTDGIAGGSGGSLPRASHRAAACGPRGLTKHFKIGGAPLVGGTACMPSTTSASPSASGRSSPWPGERQRQEHDRPAARQALQADQRRGLLPGPAAVGHPLPAATCSAIEATCRWSSRTRSARSTGIPGFPRRAALPQAAPPRTVRRAAPCGGAAGVRGRRADAGREALQRFPARAERRPAPAGRLRPGPGTAAEADPGRRARLHAGTCRSGSGCST